MHLSPFCRLFARPGSCARAVTTFLVFIVLIVLFPLLPYDAKAQESDHDVKIIRITENSALLCDVAFDPPVITIQVGTTVVWENRDKVTHTVVSARGDDPCYPVAVHYKNRAIDGGQIFQGASYQLTFDQPGTYDYMCHLPMHQMRGRIIVKPRP